MKQVEELMARTWKSQATIKEQTMRVDERPNEIQKIEEKIDNGKQHTHLHEQKTYSQKTTTNTDVVWLLVFLIGIN